MIKNLGHKHRITLLLNNTELRGRKEDIDLCLNISLPVGLCLFCGHDMTQFCSSKCTNTEPVYLKIEYIDITFTAGIKVLNEV